MGDTLLKIYHRLPASARNVAASLRGYHLRRWRYGAHSESLVEEALARDQWGATQWQRWQEERLAFVLHRAATRVPFYRDQWAERRRRGDRASWEALANWPILEKETLRQHNGSFVADDCDPRRMFREYTSGTTGKSLDLWYQHNVYQEWYALFEARWRRWYGVSRHDRWAILGGQLITPVTQRRPPFWVWNSALNQLYCSAYHLAPDLAPYYFDALQKYEVKYLWGYTSALYALAEAALHHKRDDLQFHVALTNAEPVYEYQRAAIEAAFHCPLRETYGMAEAVAAASECDQHHMHLWPEVGWLEAVNGDEPVANGVSGDLVGTGLVNVDMPLIRYRIGDRAALAAHGEACSCGRALPLLAQLEGRIDDVLYTPDGRQIGRLDPVFKARLPVHEAQIIQERLDRVVVRYVPLNTFKQADADSIVQRIQARMGAIEVALESVSEIPRGPSGKFRAVICKLPTEQLARLRSTR